MSTIAYPTAANGYLADHADLILRCYHHWFGSALVEPTNDAARALFEAPFAVLSHNTDADPLLNYANRQGLSLFAVDWDELLTLPSRLTAEAPLREERQRLLETVTRQGYIDNYSGIRIARTGQRFRIEQARVWNLFDAQGQAAGQAALLTHWCNLT